MIFRRVRYCCLLLLYPLLAVASHAQDVFVTVDDPSPNHVHPAGELFTVAVSVSKAGVPDAKFFAQWLNPAGQALAAPIALQPGQSRAIISPGTQPGHYGLRLSSTNPLVRFVPQDAGFHMDFGFSILPKADVAQRVLDNQSSFGMIHANPADPYLRGFVKTLTWNTAKPDRFARRIKSHQRQYRLQELPIISGRDWDTDHSQPITEDQIDALGNRFGAYLDALLEADVGVPAWQLGREENRNGQFEEEFFFANLKRQSARIRSELNRRGLSDVATVFSMRGFNYKYFTAFASSDAARNFDVLGFHPYKWNNFPSPERENEWLRNHIETVAGIMQAHGGPTRLWLTEFGIPHHGNNNPAGFFGYATSGIEVDGGSAEHAASYLVKSHVVALATRRVEKIFYYNYHDRGDDPQFAEHHFGLRMHAGLTRSGDAVYAGHTKPAYVAYVTMVTQLDKTTFIRSARPDDDVWVYEFSDRNPTSDGATIVAWTSAPDAGKTIALSALKAGLIAADVASTTGLYGASGSLDGERIMLTDRPSYLRVNAQKTAPWAKRRRITQR